MASTAHVAEADSRSQALIYMIDCSDSMGWGSKPFDTVLNLFKRVSPQLLVPFTHKLKPAITSCFHDALKEHGANGGTKIQHCLFEMIAKYLKTRSEKYVTFVLITDAEDSISDVGGLKKSWFEAREIHRRRTGGVLKGQCTFIGARAVGCTAQLKEVFSTEVVASTELAAHLQKMETEQAKMAGLISDLSKIKIALTEACQLHSLSSAKIRHMQATVKTIEIQVGRYQWKVEDLAIESKTLERKVSKAMELRGDIHSADLKSARRMRLQMRRQQMGISKDCQQLLCKLKVEEVKVQRLAQEQTEARKQVDSQFENANQQLTERLNSERKELAKELERRMEATSAQSKEDEAMVRSLISDAQLLDEPFVALNANLQEDFAGIQKSLTALVKAKKALDGDRQLAAETFEKVTDFMKQLVGDCSGQRAAGK